MQKGIYNSKSGLRDNLGYGEEEKNIFCKRILFTYLSAYGGEGLMLMGTIDSSSIPEF